MTIQSFVPAVWAAKIQRNLNNDHVYAKCFNRDYEGEIKGQGSSVTINMIGDITVGDYTRNSDIGDPEDIDTDALALVIDQAKYFHFAVDDVDKRQAAGEFMSAAMTQASWKLANTTDLFLGTKLQEACGNTITADTIGFGAGEHLLYDVAVQMGVALDEANTPDAGRWLVVPMWGEGMLRLDPRFTGFGTDKNRGTVRGDPIGMINSMTVYKSNNVPMNGSAYSIIAGYSGAATFAEQIMKTEAYRPQKRFSDAVKALHVYGAKVTRPANLVRFDATKGSFTS